MIEFRLLGSVELRRSDGREVEGLVSQPRRLALLAYLASAHPGLRSRDSAIGLFWPDTDQVHARAALRQALWFLRRELGERTVVRRGQDVGIDARAIWCDVIAFQGMCGATQWSEALDLYRGDLLDGFFVPDATPEIERWLDDERSRLRRLAQRAARELVKSKELASQTAAAAQLAYRWLRIAPHDEEALRTLVRLLDGMGDRAGAIRVYDEFAQHLRAELDVLPSPETIALLESVRGRSRVQAEVSAHSAATREPAILPHAGTRADGPGGDARPARPWSLLRSPSAILAAAVISLGTPVAWVSLHRAAAVRSVAVLPPSRVSPARVVGIPDLTDALISRLSQISSLTVLAYSSVEKYATREVTAQRVGQELDVAAVLSWRARHEGEAIRVDVELVRTRNGALLWSGRYTRPADALVGIENAIALDVARQLGGRLSPGERLRLSRVGTQDVEAQRLYQRGRHAWRQRSESAMRDAINYFEQAIQRDPGYAEAYAGIADCYIVLGRQQWLPPDVAFSAARVAAQRALALDSMLAEAHASLGVVLNRYDWDRSGSLREFERAIQLSPNYATGWQWYGITLETVGRTSAALAASRRALELDPLSVMVRTSFGERNFYARRYDEAARQIGYVLEVNPNFAYGHLLLGLVLLEMRRPTQAIPEFQKSMQLTDSALGLDKLAYTYAVLGRSTEARAIADRLDELSQTRWRSAVGRAEIYIALRDTARAFGLLQEAIRRKDDELVMLHINPRLDRLRDSPRFQAILDEVKLPHSPLAPGRATAH
jgi:DNA-binding SARP family transcriptional activator/TolB-like protein/Tfp pilus assembly protein PilF